MEFEINQTQYASMMQKLNKVDPAHQGSALHKAMNSVVNVVRNQLIRNTSGKILNVRTGRLRASIQARVDQIADSIVGTVGSGVLSGARVKYADIHEYGGVIKPKHGKYLKIPIRDGSRAHSTKVSGYRYVKQVTIPARKYMSKSLKQVSGSIISVLLRRIDAEINKA